jgi:phage head maturation protease
MTDTWAFQIAWGRDYVMRAPGSAEKLHEYWVHGEGAKSIRWGERGDFDRCTRQLEQHAHFTPEQAHGYCNLAHKAALGMYPATHAAREKASRAVSNGGYDEDGLDGSWDDLDGLPDLTGLGVADFEAAGGGTDPGMSRAAKLGSGARFRALKAKLAAKGASDPGALAAHIGRKRYGKAKFTALASAARKKKGGRMSRAELFRSYPLEDYHIVRTGEGDSTGRVVEAYMTVFGEETEIMDGQGHYKEDIDRSAFNKRIADLERSRNGFGAAKVFYNHGMTIHGSPSDRYSMPVAVCEGIRVESRGPLTRSRYLDTPLGNEVLEMWRSGAVTAQSFTGAIIRSSPELKPGEKYRPRNGQLPQVRRLELGLKEYGPTPFPAYQGAELVGVRMSPLGTWQAADDDEIEEIDDEALPQDEEAAPGGPPDVHPSRDHAHRLYALRTEQMLRDAGIASLKGGW